MMISEKEQKEWKKDLTELHDLRVEKAAPKLHAACKAFLDGWSHFIDCINFAKSNLDADAIRFMNEVPGQIQTAYKDAT